MSSRGCRSAMILFIIMVILWTVCLLILGNLTANGQDNIPLPTVGPVETCANHGLTEADGCVFYKVHLPVLLKGE